MIFPNEVILGASEMLLAVRGCRVQRVDSDPLSSRYDVAQYTQVLQST